MSHRPAILLALLLALPILAPATAPAARAEAPAFSVPPFRIGDLARYLDDASRVLNHSIGAPTLALDKSGQLVTTIPVTIHDWGVEYYSPHTLTLEQRTSSCTAGTRQPDGTCPTPARGVTWGQGAPAALGVTFLQGRTFQIGDSWTIPGECFCTWRNVTIGGPRANSPAGTDYVAHIRGDYSPNFFIGRIHMAQASPWPLMAEWTAQQTTMTLLNLTRGSDAIEVPTPPEIATYTPLLAPLPFVDGRPVEGTPLPGWPSWSDTRNLTGPDPADTTPGAQFLTLMMPASEFTIPLGPTGGKVVSAIFESRFALPNGTDQTTSYGYMTAHALGITSPAVLTPAAVPAFRPGSPLGTCVERSVPIWEGVREATRLPYLHNFTGFDLSYWSGSRPSCTQGTLVAFGDSFEMPSGFSIHELVMLDADAGYLLSATTFETT